MKTTEYNSIIGVIPNEGLGGLFPFGITTTKILKPDLGEIFVYMYATIIVL